MVTYKFIEQLLKENGWFLVRSKGSHRHYKHENQKETLTLAYHNVNDVVLPKTLKAYKKSLNF